MLRNYINEKIRVNIKYLYAAIALSFLTFSAAQANDIHSVSPAISSPAVYGMQNNQIARMPTRRLCFKPAGHTVKVNINVKYGQPKYDHSLGRREIADKISEQKMREHTELQKIQISDHTAGLTAVLFNSSLSAKVDAIPNNGGYCVLLQEINLDVGYDDIIVYIDKNFPENSCPYKTTLAHEKTHVGIHHTALDFYAPYIGEATYEASQKVKPIFTNSLQEANTITAGFAEQIGQEIKPVVDFFLNARNEENKKLDTPENYKYTQNMCTDWHLYK